MSCIDYIIEILSIHQHINNVNPVVLAEIRYDIGRLNIAMIRYDNGRGGYSLGLDMIPGVETFARIRYDTRKVDS